MSPHADGLHKDSSELLSQTVPVESEFCCSSRSEWAKEGAREGGKGRGRREEEEGWRERAIGGVHQPALKKAMAEPQIDTAVPGAMVTTDKLLVLLHTPFLHVPLQCPPQSQSCARMTKKKLKV